jgi:hypothetical protein
MTDETAETVEEKLARWAYVIDAQAKEIDRLRAEVASLTEGATAHQVLQSLYRNRDLPESLRAKAAATALPTERGKMPTAYSSFATDRTQRWMAYERFLRTKQSLEQTRQLPPAGWDAKLVEGVYEAPAGDGEPPMDLYGRDAVTAHVTISELMARNRRNGSGSDDL